MGFRGNLASMSLADIFQNLAANAQGGTLAVERDGVHRYVRFEGGLVVDAAREHSGKGLPPLAGYMAGRCLVNDDQAEYALRRGAEGSGNLAEIIPDLGYASKDEVHKAVARYVGEEVYDLFSWERGEFEFTDGEPPEGVFGPESASVGVRLPTGGLVMEAARRIDEWGRIRRALPSGKEVFIAGEGTEERADSLDPVSRRTFELADGTRDIDDLVADSYLSSFEVGGILCSLLESGLLRSAESKDLEDAAQELIVRRRPDRAVKVYERLLALGEDSEELRNRLAETAIQAEDPGRAVIHLGVLADRELEAGSADKAAAVWERILEVMPGNTRAHQGLAEHFRRKNRKKACLKHYVELAKSHAKVGAADRAVAAAKAGLEMNERSFELRALLSESLLAAGRKAEAADEYDRLGDQYLSDHRSRAAAEAYRKALQIEHRRKHSKSQLAAIMADEAARKRARGRMVVAVVIFLIVAVLVGLIGAYEFLVAKPRFDKAMDFARKRIEVGEACFNKGDYEGAVSAYLEGKSALLRVEMLISLHRYELVAKGLRIKCEQRISKIELTKAESEANVVKRSAVLKKGYETLLAQDDLEGARGKLEQLRTEGTEKDKKFARKELVRLNRRIAKIRAVIARASSVVNEDKWFRDAMKLVKEYPNHPEVRKLTVRIKIESDPAGALVNLPQGPSTPTPCELRFPVVDATQVTFKRKGYKDKTIFVEARDVSSKFRTVTKKLERIHTWAMRVGIQVEAPIVVSGDLAIFGDRGGNVWAVNARSGKERWRRQLGRLSAITGGVAVSAGTVFVPSLDKKIYALDRASGKNKWKPLLVGGLIRATPRVGKVRLLNNQSFVFFGAEDGRVYGVDALKGGLRWKSKRYGAIHGAVLVAGNVVYFASDDEHLRALDTTSGKEIGKGLKLGSAVRTSPLLSADGKTIYVGADNGTLYAVNIADGWKNRSVAWSFKAATSIRSGPVLHGDRVFFGTSGGTVHSLRSRGRSAEPVWEHKIGGQISAALLVTQTRVYVGSQSGQFYSLDRGNDGSPVWSYRTGGRVLSSAAWHAGLVLFGSDDGYLYAFDERR
jgi:outer membrane protein assembly factor BamB/tetratricopeptide (TPR) repeat protein